MTIVWIFLACYLTRWLTPETLLSDFPCFLLHFHRGKNKIGTIELMRIIDETKNKTMKNRRS